MDDSLVLAELRGLRGEITALRGDMAGAHQVISDKVSAGFEAAIRASAAHELLDTTRFALLDRRFVPVETALRYSRWFATTTVGAFIIGAIGILYSFLTARAQHP